MNGPFGNYERKSAGDVLNALHAEGVPIHIAESVNIGPGSITYAGKAFALYDYFEGIEQPLFLFQQGPYGQQQFVVEGESLAPRFRLSLSTHMTPGLIIRGRDATPDLHDFLASTLTNFMKDPWYQVHKDAGAFFQGGYGSPKGEFFYIEFTFPAKAQAYVDKVNAEYRRPYESSNVGG